MTDNGARVAVDEVREEVIPGQETHIVLSKTNITALGPPYSQCSETEDYMQVTFREDCFNKAVSEICGYAYPGGCGSIGGWTKECQNASDSLAFHLQLKSQCILQCPAECNQISFEFNRRDVEYDSDQGTLDYYNDLISGKFDITGQADVICIFQQIRNNQNQSVTQHAHN